MPRPGQHKTGTRQSQEHSGLAQDCSGQAQDSLKTAQDTPKIGPRWSKAPQHNPRLLETRARQAQYKPREPWALPKTAQDGLKTHPRRAQARAESVLDCLAWLLPTGSVWTWTSWPDPRELPEDCLGSRELQENYLGGWHLPAPAHQCTLKLFLDTPR